MANLKKLVNVISKLKVAKERRNEFAKYNYRSLEDILVALKPLMQEYQILVSMTDSIEKVGDRYYVKAVARVIDIEDGTVLAESSAYARESLSEKGKAEAQSTGSASSYARRYALGGIFNLETNKDHDEIAGENAPTGANPVPKQRQAHGEGNQIIHYSQHKLSEMLANAGIDAGDFSKLVFGVPLEQLKQHQVDASVMEFHKAIAKYKELDQKRPMGA